MHGCKRRDAVRNATLLAIIALLTMGTGGCGSYESFSARPTPRPPVARTATVRDLVTRVGMTVIDSSHTGASLRRGSHVVMLFPGPGGKAYLDGKPIEIPGGGTIEAHGSELRFPHALVDAIAAALPRPTPPRPIAITPEHGPKPGVKPLPVKLGRVIIDPGHGGNDPGTDAAVRLYGMQLYEKSVNLAISLAVADMLKRRGVEVRMTRDSDRAVSLDQRVHLANSLKPKLFISIHANSMPQTSRRGFMILRPAVASADSLAAASTVERRLRAIGLGGEVRADTRGLRVLKKTTCPAILVETAYLSNRYDAQLLANPKSRTKIATAIADGITEFLKKRASSPRR